MGADTLLHIQTLIKFKGQMIKKMFEVQEERREVLHSIEHQLLVMTKILNSQGLCLLDDNYCGCYDVTFIIINAYHHLNNY